MDNNQVIFPSMHIEHLDKIYGSNTRKLIYIIE